MCVGLHVLFFLALPWIHAHLEEEHGVPTLHAHYVAPLAGGLGDEIIDGAESEMAKLSIAIEDFLSLFHAGMAISPYASSRLVDPPLSSHISDIVISSDFQCPSVLASRPVTRIVPFYPLSSFSSGERARLLGADLSPPIA